jgi:hypothetical protein
MFSEKFKQLAEKVGINIDDIISRCDKLEEKFDGVDKQDISSGALWLEELAVELQPKELAFLLISALSPSSMADDSVEEYLKAQGFKKLEDGTFVKNYDEDPDQKKKDAEQINKKFNIPIVDASPPEFLNQEEGRNALGYNHNLNSAVDAIGVKVDDLNNKILFYQTDTDGKKVSVKIETLERNFTRKELSYMYQSKVTQYDDTISVFEQRIQDLISEVETITVTPEKPKRQTRKTNKKNDV